MALMCIQVKENDNSSSSNRQAYKIPQTLFAIKQGDVQRKIPKNSIDINYLDVRHILCTITKLDIALL